MAAFPSYSTGTVSVTNGGTVVTGAGGANWSGVNAKPGDTLLIQGHEVIVVDVTDSTHLVVDAWPYTTAAGVAYEIYKTSPLRFAGGDAMADVSTLVAALNTDGFYVFVDPDDLVPDPSYGEENQFALQPTTGKLWLKTGGVWVIQSSSAVGTRLNYSTTTADADPGAGTFRLNNATPASATAAYLDNVDVNGTTVSSIWDRLDDSTNTVKGVLRFQAANNANVWAAFEVTGTVVDGTGYRKVTLANGVGSGAFTNGVEFTITFFRSGDVGATGSTGIGYGGTSTTSVLIGTGSKLFSIQSGLAYQVGNYVRASSSANGANYMEGFVTAYVAGSPTLITINVTKVGGSGTFASWNFSISGAPGTGDLLASNNLSDVANAATAAGNLSAVRYASQALTSGQRTQARSNINAVLRGHIAGLTLSTAGSSSSFQVAEGECADSTSIDLITFAGLQKNTAAWSLGNNGGALDTGTIANGWYHAYMIKRPDTGVVDVLISIGATVPTVLPTNYTLFRRIGSLYVSSGNFLKFIQTGDLFIWDTAKADISVSTLSSTAVLYALSTPFGVKTTALLRAYVTHASAGTVILLSSPDESDQAAAGSNFNVGATQAGGGVISATSLAILTNTSSQIRARSNVTSTTLGASTYGWIDRRGQDA